MNGVSSGWRSIGGWAPVPDPMSFRPELTPFIRYRGVKIQLLTFTLHLLESGVGFNTGQPFDYMQMGGTPGWPPGQVPYAPHSMSPQYQGSSYGVQSQQQWTPSGLMTFQMAQNSTSTAQMVLAQCTSRWASFSTLGSSYQNQHQNESASESTA